MSQDLTTVGPVPTAARHPHEGGCECCRAAKVCNVCGTPLGHAACTNGRCSECHRQCCSPGGGDRPGHGYGEIIPSKVWNSKGSPAAKRRMAELRDRAQFLVKADLIDEWARITGRQRREWWDAARAAGLRAGCGNTACVRFLRDAIAIAKGDQT